MAWSRRLALAVVALLGGWGCEQIIDADFGEKTLLQPGTGGGGGTGGSVGGGGSGGSLLDLGEPCNGPTECESGWCADGVCCNSECEGDCQQCDLDGSEGTCTPHEVLTPCGSAPPGVCDGSGSCATGEPIWSTVLGGAGDDSATACAFDGNGDLVVVGYFSHTLDFGGDSLTPSPPTEQAIFIAKLGGDGAHRWSIMIDGSLTALWVNDLATHPEGGIAVIGNFTGTLSIGGDLLQHNGPGPHSTYIIKLNGLGDYEWSAMATSPYFEGSQEIAVDAAGAVVVAGCYEDPVTVGGTVLTSGGATGTYIARFDPNGTLGWVETHEVSSPGAECRPAGVRIGSDGDAFVTGTFSEGDITFGTTTLQNAGIGGHDVFLVRLDSLGAVTSATRYGGIASQYVEGLTMDGLGRLGLVGSFNESINFGSGSLTNMSAEGNLVIDFDVYAAVIHEDTSHVWSTSYGPFNAATPHQTAVGSDGVGNLALIGYTRNQPIDFGAGALPATSADGTFLTRVNVDGTTLWSKAFDASGGGAPGSRLKLEEVTSAVTGRTAVCGWLAGQTDLGTGSLIAESGGSQDILIGTFEP